MSHYILIQDKVIHEGDTIEIKAEGVGIDPIKIEITDIDPKSQSFSGKLNNHDSTISIPVSTWPDASIIEERDMTDPNILFKLKEASHSGHNDGQ